MRFIKENWGFALIPKTLLRRVILILRVLSDCLSHLATLSKKALAIF